MGRAAELPVGAWASVLLAAVAGMIATEQDALRLLVVDPKTGRLLHRA